MRKAVRMNVAKDARGSTDAAREPPEDIRESPDDVQHAPSVAPPLSVLILGGGAFGLSTAAALRSRRPHPSINVTVLDRQSIPAVDASSTDISKIIRFDYGADRLYTRLARLAMRAWMGESGCAETDGVYAPWFRKTGLLLMTSRGEAAGTANGDILADRTTPQPHFERDSYQLIHERLKIAHLERMQLSSATVSSDATTEFTTRFPHMDPRPLADGYFNPVAGWADSGATMHALADYCRSLGVTLEPHAAFSHFLRGGSSSLSSASSSSSSSTASSSSLTDDDIVGVATMDGREFRADVIIVACGAWTASILPEMRGLIEAHGQPVLHLRVPEAERAAVREEGHPVFGVDLSTRGYYGFPMTDEGLIKVAKHGSGYINSGNGDGATERGHGNDATEQASNDTAPQANDNKLSEGKNTYSTPRTIIDDPRQSIPLTFLHDIRNTLLPSHFPRWQTYPVASVRMCWYCDAWDGNFFVDRVPGYGGRVVVASGGSGHGFKFAPVIGEIVADVVHEVVADLKTSEPLSELERAQAHEHGHSTAHSTSPLYDRVLFAEARARFRWRTPINDGQVRCTAERALDADGPQPLHECRMATVEELAAVRSGGTTTTNDDDGRVRSRL